MHYEGCPEIDDNKTLAVGVWSLGYTGGRTGILGSNEGVGNRDTYLLGWIAGDIAADTAANGE